MVDGVLREPEDGVGADVLLATSRLHAALRAHLSELVDLDAATLVTDRRDRFARFGSDFTVQESETLAVLAPFNELLPLEGIVA